MTKKNTCSDSGRDRDRIGIVHALIHTHHIQPHAASLTRRTMLFITPLCSSSGVFTLCRDGACGELTSVPRAEMLPSSMSCHRDEIHTRTGEPQSRRPKESRPPAK